MSLVLGNKDTETATLTATVLPENATDKTVRWTAAPEGVVTLTDNGNGSCTVTALGGESAIVTAVSVANPAATAACRISVDYPYLTNIALIEAIDDRAKDSAGNPVSVDWTKESNGTVKLTPQNLAKIRAVTELNLDGSGFSSEEKLEDLSGIEYFTGLTYLNCRYNKLAELDVSGCTALTELDCRVNDLTTLDVSGCTALTTLSCSSNNLTTLDVSGCTALTNLSCFNNNLTTLDVSGCTALTELTCYGNNLTTLDVSDCTALTELNCGYNNLKQLDVTNNTALTFLNCGDNSLTTLDIRPLSGLSSLYCTPQKQYDWGVATQSLLTLKLTRKQKSYFRLENGEYLKLEVYN